MTIAATPKGLPEYRYPVDPWRLVEREYDGADLGVTETLFAVGNGYLGMRANPEEGREAHSHGTFLNGFHETWAIHHAEEAFAFAKTGQTIVNAPDAKLMKLYVDDEPLLLAGADLDSYERVLDFRSGVLTRDLMWRTPAGKRVHVRSQRMVCFEHRHLAVLTFEVTLLDEQAPIVVSSQLLNRQDGEDEYHVSAAALGEGLDPRRSRKFDQRVLVPRLQQRDGDDVVLGYRCANSKMTLACGYRHIVETAGRWSMDTTVGEDLAKTVITARTEPGQTLRIVKLVSYHTSTGVPPEELADRCWRTIDRAVEEGVEQLFADQRSWLDDYWSRSDIELVGEPAAQQALRWNLFHLAQASARTQEQGIAAKGVTGGGYGGHYFWDTEVYVVPFLSYTSQAVARKLMRFRWQMLPAARARAQDLDQRGALYPWRTINGEEASAYYAAGTAQYHINAAIAFALLRYLDASGDVDFLAREGAEILVETARLWEDLGFYANNGDQSFHIHRVTGPDEYTTVVNDNFYTNVMARFNLRYAANTVGFLGEWDADAYAALCRRTGLTPEEITGWHRAAEAMYLPFDEELRIHPQDTNFLELEQWDFASTPADMYPLLLHYHPLVIYRHQVLKQADVVLALFLRGEQFSVEQRKRDFDYYDPITTGDSSLSTCVQSIVAAQVGYDDLALDYFRRALYLDLTDLHDNTADGVHIASAGGVWADIVYGFAGFHDTGESVNFTPRLPSCWEKVTFHLTRHASVLRVEVVHKGCTVTVVSGPGVQLEYGDDRITLADGESQFYERVAIEPD